MTRPTLQRAVPDGTISADMWNDNFDDTLDYIDDQADDITTLSATVTSQGSTITTQGTSISNLQSTVSGLGGTYSDLSLSNTNGTGKRNVENWHSPNVNSRWGIGSGYVTTQPGYISVIMDGTSDDVDGWVNINGVAVYHKHEGGDWSSGHDSCFFAVQQGVVVHYGSSNCNFYVTFWACVGG